MYDVQKYKDKKICTSNDKCMSSHLEQNVYMCIAYMFTYRVTVVCKKGYLTYGRVWKNVENVSC